MPTRWYSDHLQAESVIEALQQHSSSAIYCRTYRVFQKKLPTLGKFKYSIVLALILVLEAITLFQ